jgi:hypothetical protein
MADVLYGVTMQEQGISKIVSVRFHKAEEQGTDALPASTEMRDFAEEEPAAAPAQKRREEPVDIVMAK